jgi:hypothetical protein
MPKKSSDVYDLELAIDNLNQALTHVNKANLRLAGTGTSDVWNRKLRRTASSIQTAIDGLTLCVQEEVQRPRTYGE